LSSAIFAGSDAEAELPSVQGVPQKSRSHFVFWAAEEGRQVLCVNGVQRFSQVVQAVICLVVREVGLRTVVLAGESTRAVDVDDILIGEGLSR
jgi:hypothetical protein